MRACLALTAALLAATVSACKQSQPCVVAYTGINPNLREWLSLDAQPGKFTYTLKNAHERSTATGPCGSADFVIQSPRHSNGQNFLTFTAKGIQVQVENQGRVQVAWTGAGTHSMGSIDTIALKC